MYKIQVTGNMTTDPEPWKEFNGEPSAKFSVASSNNHGGKKYVAYFNCTAFGGAAKFALNYLRKGSPVYMEGEPSIYVGKDGKAHYGLSVKALEAMSNRSSGAEHSDETAARPAKKASEESGDTVDVTEEFLRSGNITPPTPEPVENIPLPWDDKGADDDPPF